MQENIFSKIDDLIGQEISKSEHYETYEDLIVDYIAESCFYSSKDFIRNIIYQLEKRLEE